jgi:hypothetical protein
MTPEELESRLRALRATHPTGWLIVEDSGTERGIFASQSEADDEAMSYGGKCRVIEIATGKSKERWYDR